ncbi:hypothetical protein GCM10027162_32210 [Streptomyces incanus]
MLAPGRETVPHRTVKPLPMTRHGGANVARCGTGDLVILSAQDFGGHPLARVHLPGRVPLGFHGSWIPDA